MALAVESRTRGDRLAAWAAEVRWDDLEPVVRDKVKVHILDVFAVACAGLDTWHGRAMQRAARGWSGVEESTVIGLGWRMPAATAAMINAFHTRANTFDDTHEKGPTHPGSSAVAAALACCEATSASGRTFLAAVLAGYEVTTRVSAAVAPWHYDAGFHNTGTCNTFGACAAASRALGLDPHAAIEAMGLAGEGAAGLRRYQRAGTRADTSMDGARAAQTGVMAAQFRAAGLPGATGIIDGDLGFARVMSPECDLARLDRGLGVDFEFMATTIKPYPSCRSTHAPIATLAELRERHAIDAHGVAAVTIAAYGHSVEVADRPQLRNHSDAAASHQHCAAVTLAKGTVTLDDFSEANIADPWIRELAGRVKVVHDPALDANYPEMLPVRVTVAMNDGRTFEGSANQPPGMPDDPLPADIVRAKYLSLAEPVLGRDRARDLAAAVLAAEEIADIRALRPLLAPS